MRYQCRELGCLGRYIHCSRCIKLCIFEICESWPHNLVTTEFIADSLRIAMSQLSPKRLSRQYQQCFHDYSFKSRICTDISVIIDQSQALEYTPHIEISLVFGR
jgi:hypothetical protein